MKDSRFEVKISQHPMIGRGWWWKISHPEWYTYPSGYATTLWGAKWQVKRTIKRIVNGSGEIEYTILGDGKRIN